MSRPSRENIEEDDKLTSLIPPDAFINVFEASNSGTIEHDVIEAQRRQKEVMHKWEKTLPIERTDTELGPQWHNKEGRLVIPSDEEMKRLILRELHDHWGAGHLG